MRNALAFIAFVTKLTGLSDGFAVPFSARSCNAPRRGIAQFQAVTNEAAITTADVVVIGSGIAGLSAGALAAAYGDRVVVVESHVHAGGCAHAFQRSGFHFDSGPSLFSGLSIDPSPNPLKHVLNAVGESVEWLTYDTWGVSMPEGDFQATVGPEGFQRTLGQFGGPDADRQWATLTARLLGMSEVTMGLPPFCLRQDPWVLLTAAPYLPALFKAGVTDPFIKNWLNMLCFLLQGMPSEGTLTAVMAYMISDFYRPGVVLDYPKGGTGALVDALVNGLERHGGKLMLSAHVEQVIVEDGRAVGVRLRGGREIRATKKVVSNASIWDTLSLLPEGALPPDFVESRERLPACKSFMHVHLGVRADESPVAAVAAMAPLLCHYAVVGDWSVPIDAPGNVIIVSIPSVLDPSLAPPGCHVVHAYTAGNEPYEVWEGLNTASEEYKALKAERAAVLMRAVERVFPGLKERLEMCLVGTPLTHERFLRRHRGSYGPEVVAGQTALSGPGTPLDGLVCTGDSVWPGIGVPAVAASGTLVANSMASPWAHRQMLKRIGFGGV